MLPRIYKLKRDNDFKKVFEKGKYFQNNFIRIKFNKNDLRASQASRFGFMVGLKVSKKAVERNKIRRWLEEVIRLNLNQIKTGFDLVVMVSPEILGKKHQEVEITLISLLKKGNLIK